MNEYAVWNFAFILASIDNVIYQIRASAHNTAMSILVRISGGCKYTFLHGKLLYVVLLVHKVYIIFCLITYN